MPIVRKIAPQVAATWADPSPAEPIPVPSDRRGLTRMDYPESGSIGWMARVYYGGTTFTRYFSDARYAGPAGALRRAEIWRAEMRQRVEQRPKPTPPDGMRIVRVERPEQKLVGWYVYVRAGGRQCRRYLSDARYGGMRGAREAGEQWAAEQLNKCG